LDAAGFASALNSLVGRDPFMVTLSRIYTKTGDGGETSLGDGTRVPKDHPRVVAYGSVDELNAFVGMLVALAEPPPEHALLKAIQNDLLDLGGDLCVPIAPDEATGSKLRILPTHSEKLERAIDRLNADLPPLRSFVIPGGPPAAAWAHLARTVCRRAERDVITLSRQESINPNVTIYLNRLSDFLFVLARVADRKEKPEELWTPGKNSEG
jgi:cob(I)alamin adenosyltransferase